MDIEELRQEVKAISASVTKLRASGISENALVALIQKACPSYLDSRRRIIKPSVKIIRAVMDGMESLEAYVFNME